jgi:hypothetical protein
MMPKITFLYTFHLMDYKRSLYDAEIARAHAKWEKENPDKIIIESNSVPVSEKIREHALQICGAAYQRVIEKTTEKEKVYQTVLTAMVDFNDRFGNTFDTFDDYHQEQINHTCDRILAYIEENLSETKGTLTSTAPPGFTREIMDALDNAVRYREIYS